MIQLSLLETAFCWKSLRSTKTWLADLVRFYKILLEIIKSKIRIFDPDKEHLEACKPYFPENEFADLYHAATCLKAKATIITNDKHFDKIKEKGLIDVWSISEAIERLL